MADIDVVEVRDCPFCGEPMRKLRTRFVWNCLRCSEDEDPDDNDEGD